MCIIISKDKNCDRLPTMGELKNCFEYNRDGAGFMYVNNNKVIIEKGFMELENFLNRFQELCEKYNDFKKKALVIHCRIGTSSGNTPENTHPYAVTTKEKNLHKLYFETDLAVVHNGIITAYNPRNMNSKTNDTQNFILQYLAPIHKHYKTAYKMEKFRDGIKNITNSKFVFLDKNENTYYVGDFINEKGVKFSNSTYKSFTSYSYCNNYSKYNYFDSLYDDEDDFDSIYYEFYDKNKNLIYLEPTWFFWCDNVNQYLRVDEFEEEIIYSLDDSKLYFMDENDELVVLGENVRVYNEDFKLVI